MKIRILIRTALRSLVANKIRTFLTMLGIVIGITAIILIVSLGGGAQQLILSEIQGLGSRTIVVLPGREPKGPSDAAQIFSDSLRERDIAALLRPANVPRLQNLTPLLFGGESAARGSETYRLTLFGGSSLIAQLFDLQPSEGIFFNEDDVRSRSAVVVLGTKAKEELFGGTNAVGEKVRIRGRAFRVIGVLPSKGQVSFFNFDEAAIVPYTTAAEYVFGIKYFHRIIIEAESEEAIPATVRDIERTIRESHHIDDPEKDDFFVETQADLADRIGLITNILTLFLTSVAGISLLVGGVGIMNIMLVSVTERTREIGLRMAVGARQKDILNQFLLEAMLLTLSGGLIGIILGAALSILTGIVIGAVAGVAWPLEFPVMGALIGLVVSTAIGLGFGIYPARTASRKNPIEALRYE